METTTNHPTTMYAVVVSPAMLHSVHRSRYQAEQTAKGLPSAGIVVGKACPECGHFTARSRTVCSKC